VAHTVNIKASVQLKITQCLIEFLTENAVNSSTVKT